MPPMPCEGEGSRYFSQPVPRKSLFLSIRSRRTSQTDKRVSGLESNISLSQRFGIDVDFFYYFSKFSKFLIFLFSQRFRIRGYPPNRPPPLPADFRPNQGGGGSVGGWVVEVIQWRFRWNFGAPQARKFACFLIDSPLENTVLACFFFAPAARVSNPWDPEFWGTRTCREDLQILSGMDSFVHSVHCGW